MYFSFFRGVETIRRQEPVIQVQKSLPFLARKLIYNGMFAFVEFVDMTFELNLLVMACILNRRVQKRIARSVCLEPQRTASNSKVEIIICFIVDVTALFPQYFLFLVNIEINHVGRD